MCTTVFIFCFSYVTVDHLNHCSILTLSDKWIVPVDRNHSFYDKGIGLFPAVFGRKLLK